MDKYDEMLARWEAESKHSLRVSMLGGVIGLALVAVFCWLTASETFWYHPEAAITSMVAGPLVVFAGVIIAHFIDDRRK